MHSETQVCLLNNIDGSSKLSKRKPRGKCPKISVHAGAKTFALKVHWHFRDKIQERMPNFPMSELKYIIQNSIVILSRPRNVIAMLNNNFRRAIYLYSEDHKLVFVLDENVHTHVFDVLKTAYTASDCNWIDEWLSANPRQTRQYFVDYFRDKTLKL